MQETSDIGLMRQHTSKHSPLWLEAGLNHVLAPAADAETHGVVCGATEQTQFVEGLHHCDTGLRGRDTALFMRGIAVSSETEAAKELSACVHKRVSTCSSIEQHMESRECSSQHSSSHPSYLQKV